VLFEEAAATRLSELRDISGRAAEPDLVICGTATINAAREVPRGQAGFCVAFDADHVTLRAERGLNQESARASTSDYEALLGKRRSDLFDISAISGAAIPPLTGAATRHAYRILFTFTNIRLGVWLPHPTCVRDARDLLDRLWDREHYDRAWTHRRLLLLLLWYLVPHPLWDRLGRNRDREARIWAHVLNLRLRGRPAGAFWYRLMQPTLGLLWAEASGRLSYRSTWMYVTDGGRYDNLGLVEALRRGASHIVVLDASGDKADTWSTIGRAIALARADTGVQIDLDPTTMIRGGRDLAPGQVVRPWAHGTFTRPDLDEDPYLPRLGEIWLCKLAWWTGAPWDILAYAREHPSYPSAHSQEQLYDITDFEAYKQLGAATIADVANNWNVPGTQASALEPEPAPRPPVSDWRRPAPG
jgi:hypothetical protein